jgi:hypothetical protein
MCGSHLCGGSRTCTCMIGVFLGLSPSSFTKSRCGDIQHYLLSNPLASSVHFTITLFQPIYKDVTLVSLIVPPYHLNRYLPFGFVFNDN